MGDDSRPTFRLHGPEEVFDPRVTPVRDDLADIALAGRIFVPHYAVPIVMRCGVPGATLYKQASDRSNAVSELLFGEVFAVLDITESWAWGYCLHDHYTGYVARGALEPMTLPDDYGSRVKANATALYADADSTANVRLTLPIGSRVRLDNAEEGRFLAAHGGFLFAAHIAETGDKASDPVALAEQLVGTPYVWGGRGYRGLDCSGLVQLVAGFAGIQLPRDSDQQMAALTGDLAAEEPLRRGDIIFFSGHVGIMVDEAHLVHATGYHMQVVVEPLETVEARFAKHKNSGILARKRIGL